MFLAVTQGSIAGSACCPAGTYWIGGSSKCTDCAAGKYNDEEGKTVCTDCAKGTYNDEEGSTAETDCTDCAAGKYNDQKGRTACANCIKGKLSLIHI